MKTCTMNGCNMELLAFGLCTGHYEQRCRLEEQERLKPPPRVRVKSNRVCSFDGCEREHNSTGLCSVHGRQQREGKPLTPIKSRTRRTRAMIEADLAAGLKTCVTCKRRLPLSEYTKSAKETDGLQYDCKRCKADRVRQRLYGLPPGALGKMLEVQGGACAICRTTDPGDRSWQTDHNHACCKGKNGCGKCVRGILCQTCNVTLGWYEKRPEGSGIAIEAFDNYLANPLYWLSEEEEQQAASFYGWNEQEMEA